MSLKAAIFDLDGVLTKTAKVHFNAWKKTFDPFLKSQSGESFQEFSWDDYSDYVDGKFRYDGVESFLNSRSIKIPFGYPHDDLDEKTICGLGNCKNEFFHDILNQDGVEIYESTVNLVHQMQDEGIRVGVASSSKNCQLILQRTDLDCLFQARIDGLVSAELNLDGFPEPDILLKASNDLGVSPEEIVVVEDHIAGIQAAKRAEFGLIVGVARDGNKADLIENGADVVVKDLSDISLNDLKQKFE